MKYTLVGLLALWAAYIFSGFPPFNEFPLLWKIVGGCVFLASASAILFKERINRALLLFVKAALWVNFLFYVINSTPDREVEIQPLINPYVAYSIVAVFTLICFLLIRKQKIA